MNAHLKAFLQFLRLNRNASAHTVRAYESDLSQFLDHAAALTGLKRAALAPAHLDRTALRGFLADLHRRGLSRASAARKLAAARTFLRYLRREGMVDDDAGAMVPTPKRDVRMPVHLSGEATRLVTARHSTSLRAPRPRHPRAVLRVRAAVERARRPRRGRRQPQCADGATPARAGSESCRSARAPHPRFALLKIGVLVRRPEATLQPTAAGRCAARSLVRELPRHTAHRQEHRSPGAAVRGRLRHAAGRQPARAAAFLRHASAPARRRSSGDSGTARPRAVEHHSAIYPRQYRTARGGLQEKPSESGPGRKGMSAMDPHGSITVYTGPMFSARPRR